MIGAPGTREAGEAIDILPRGTRNNPLHAAALGDDPELRRQAFRGLMGAAFAVEDLPRVLVAPGAEGGIGGDCAVLPPAAADAR